MIPDGILLETSAQAHGSISTKASEDDDSGLNHGFPGLPSTTTISTELKDEGGVCFRYDGIIVLTLVGHISFSRKFGRQSQECP